MAEAASRRRRLTAEAWVQSQASPCGVCNGQIGTGTGSSPTMSVFPRIISPVLHAHLSVYDGMKRQQLTPALNDI